MLVEWLDRRCGAATVVLGQGHEHPAHAGAFVPRAVEDVLTRVHHLLATREGPVRLAVTHAGLAAADEEVPIGLIDVHAVRPQRTKELRGEAPLREARVRGAALQWRAGGRVAITGVRPVLLEQVEARLGEE